MNPVVLSIRNEAATNWERDSNCCHWQHVNQEAVTALFNEGLKRFTEKDSLKEAWEAIIPYKPGENIAIKVNNNNIGWNEGYDDDQDPLGETIISIIEGLLLIGALETNIWITDPSRELLKRMRETIQPAYPNIKYYIKPGGDNLGFDNVIPTSYVDPTSEQTNTATCPDGEKILIAQVFVDADHLINMPLFKAHHKGSGSHPYSTCALKNHYGSVLFEHFDLEGMHYYFNQGDNKGNCNLEQTNVLADINNNPNIKDKTRLILVDGLFGNYQTNWGTPGALLWNKMFNGKDPNMLVFSKDPIAISCVIRDYIKEERNDGILEDQQLKAGNYIGLGVYESGWDTNMTYKNFTFVRYECESDSQTKEQSCVVIHDDRKDPDPKPIDPSLAAIRFINQLIIIVCVVLLL